MRSCGNDISILERRGNDACGNETGDVGHIYDKVCAAQICDFAHPFVVNQSAVGRSSSNENFGAIHQSVFLQHLIVDYSGFKIYSVGKGFEICGDGGDPGIVIT